MSYTPTIWSTGDVISANKLNKMEEGIAGESREITELKSAYSYRGVIDGGALSSKQDEGWYFIGETALPEITDLPDELVGYQNICYLTNQNTGSSVRQQLETVFGRRFIRFVANEAVGSWQVVTDISLSIAGAPADAKTVGDRITASDGFGVYAFSENIPSKWSVMHAISGFVTATLVKTVTVTVSGTYASGAAYSDPVSIALPYHVADMSLSATGQDGLYITDVEPVTQDQQTHQLVTASGGAVAARFRVVFPAGASGSQTVTLRFALSGREAEAPVDCGMSTTDGRYDALRIARSYINSINEPENRLYMYGPNWMYLSSDKLNDSQGRGLVDCATYMQMVLRAIPYEQSPYKHNKSPNASFDYNDLVNNPNDLDWAYRIVSNMTGHESWVTPKDLIGRDVRFAPDIAFMAWLEGCVFSGIQNALTGDFAFFTHSKTGRSFSGVHHIAMMSWENSEWWIYEVEGIDVTGGRIIHRRRLINREEQPAFYARLIHN